MPADEQPLDPRQPIEGLVEGGGAAALGEHQPAAGAGECGRHAGGREVRLQRQVRDPCLQDPQDGGHPVQVALRHHRHHRLAGQPARQQRPGQPVRAGVELPVGPLPAAVHGRDGVRVLGHAPLEQLVHPAIRQLPRGPGETVELEPGLVGRQQPLPPVLGVRVRDDLRERGEVVAGDPGGALGVQHVRPVPQPQRTADRPAAGKADVQHSTAARAGRVRPTPVGSNTVSTTGRARASSHLEVVDRENPACARSTGLGSNASSPPGPATKGPVGREAGQRPDERGREEVPGHHVALAGQRGEHLRVRGQGAPNRSGAPSS